MESRTQGSRPRTQKNPRPRPRTAIPRTEPLEAKDTKKSEAKAKDSLSEDKPSRGQGQECSRPRPRTKDIAASVFQKQNKKRSSKSFSGNLQFIGAARIFDWRGLNHKSRAMTSSKICQLALKQDFAKEEGLN